MLPRIFYSPIIDILLIILIIRFVFPSLFSFKVYRFNQQNNNHNYRENETGEVIVKQPKKKFNPSDKAGEYIEFEEVKENEK